MPAPTITPAPPAPQRTVPATFSPLADAFVEWMEGLPTEMNAFGSYLDGLGLSGTSWKAAVRLKTTGNHGLSGLADIDGVTPVAGNRIFVGSNTAPAENGIYVAAAGAWTRATDFDAADEVLGAGIYVIAGTTNGGTLWLNTNTTTPTLGTTALTFAQFGGLPEASDSDMWTGTSSAKTVTPKKIFDAAKFQTLADGATITPDFAAGLNFKVTLGGNRTLANPTNAKDGQSGVIRVIQDGTGSRTLSYGSNWRFPGGAASGGVLSTAASSIDIIAYVVGDDGLIYATLSKAFAA